jgi:hypothetical protein
MLMVALLVLAAAACAPEIEPQEAVQKAVDKTSQVQSYRSAGIALTQAGNETLEYLFELEFTTPDRYHGSAQSNGDWSESIIIGSEGYVRSSDQPDWKTCQVSGEDGMPSPTPQVSTTPAPTPTPSGICVIVRETLQDTLRPLELMEEIEVLADEEIDGVNTSHYRGDVDQESYLGASGSRLDRGYREVPEQREEISGWQMTGEVWIDRDDYIRQLKTDLSFEQVDPGTGEQVTFTQIITTRLFDFNEPVSIEPPEVE